MRHSIGQSRIAHPLPRDVLLAYGLPSGKPLAQQRAQRYDCNREPIGAGGGRADRLASR